MHSQKIIYTLWTWCREKCVTHAKNDNVVNVDKNVFVSFRWYSKIIQIEFHNKLGIVSKHCFGYGSDLRRFICFRVNIGSIQSEIWTNYCLKCAHSRRKTAGIARFQTVFCPNFWLNAADVYAKTDETSQVWSIPEAMFRNNSYFVVKFNLNYFGMSERETKTFCQRCRFSHGLHISVSMFSIMCAFGFWVCLRNTKATSVKFECRLNTSDWRNRLFLVLR